MVNSIHTGPISRQGSVGAAYDVPTSVSATDLALMPRMDALHLEHPFMGVRKEIYHAVDVL
jgi:putative transposase